MEMTTVVSSVKEKVAALTTTGSSLGDSEGLRKWSLRSERWVKDSERRLASRRRNSKRRLAAKPGKSGSCSQTADVKTGPLRPTGASEGVMISLPSIRKALERH